MPADRPALLPHPRSVTWGVGRLRPGTGVDAALDPGLAVEAYRLEVSPTGVSLLAGSADGLRPGRSVLDQLRDVDGTLPVVTVRDEPAHRWWGLMLDVARTFLPLEFLHRVVDALADLRLKLWTEYVPTPEHAAYMLFPRLAAFAERVWRGDDDSVGFADFEGRLPAHLARLDALGLNYRPV